MSELFSPISEAAVKALGELYRKCERIEIREGMINGESVPGDACAAIIERIKINADLEGERFIPGAASQILLQFDGQSREFDVMVGPDRSIDLRLRQ